ncbi:GNAT family N-acetyltransferase [Pseudorhodobacter sp.]|uniref:GNAT family N-acetyltransferase n=1 Tax=Pseudorhodobacter sp. TaxID=1934400 RepID=UPI002648FED0|nr:GNAT family N-acetyltransferase [Pseudorhodobacter sp.]MDN5786925.1 GNAT family N-acetyltransferase [Pseudorhodobacter sp.]
MTPAGLYAALEATWPAASCHRTGPWMIREGKGGGQRVSAATAETAVQGCDVALAEQAMTALGQTPLFMIREHDTGLDALLAARGYMRHDPVVIYAVPVSHLAAIPPAPMTSFAMWPALEIATQLWADAGIGAGRLAVMKRAMAPKTAILGRMNDRAAGAAFVACCHDIAMLHALEVSPGLRRQGAANHIMRMAAAWAQDNGASQLCLAVTEANGPARALYSSLGMEVVGTYHYRKK